MVFGGLVYGAKHFCYHGKKYIQGDHIMRHMRVFRFAALVVAALFLAVAAPVAQAGEPDLTILFTTDIHANITPYRAEVDGEIVRVGGFSRLKSAIDQNYAADKTLLLDAGDFPIGTMFQHFFLEGSVELPLLERLGYDAVALGNHDFDYGEAGLKTCLSSFKANGGSLDFLCTNLIEKGGAAPSDQYTNPLAAEGVANYKIMELNGYRIGIFSLMGEEAQGYIVNDKLAFADPTQTAKNYVRILREEEKVDMVLLLSHCGTIPGTAWTEDEDIAKAVDGIDLIVSGHSHAALDEPITVGNTTIVCAGTALKNLGKLELSRQGGHWQVRSHALIPLTDAFEEDAEIAAFIAGYEERIREEYLRYYGVGEEAEDIVALSPATFPNGDEMCVKLSPYPFSQLLMDAYAYALYDLAGEEDVDFAVLAVGSIRSTLYQGGVSVAEIYNALGYGDSPVDGRSGSPVITAYVTGRELYDVAETSASLSSIVSAAQLFFTGLRYTMDEGRPLLNRVYEVELLDRATGKYYTVKRDDTLYKLACSYSAANLISLVESSSFGLFSVTLRDENGEPVAGEALLENIVHYPLPTGEERELKEWYALYAYIMQLPTDAEGLHVIPERYGDADGAADYMRVTHRGLAVFFKNPTKPARIVFFAALGLLILIALIIVLSVRRKRRKKAKKA